MTPDMTSHHTSDAVVIGGGFSGVAAARELRRAGWSVTLLEARNRLGGRTWWKPFAEGANVEFGGAWLSREKHVRLAREVDRYRISVLPAHDGPVRFRWALNHVTDAFPIAETSMEALERAFYAIIGDARRIDPDVPRDDQDLADLDVSLGAYVDSLGVPPDVRDFLQAWSALGTGALVSEFSALATLSWVADLGASVWAYWASVSERFADGTESLLAAMASELDLDIQLNSPVTRVIQGTDAVTVQVGVHRSFEAAAVILAVPVNVIADISFEPALSEGKREVAEARHPGRMRKFWMLVENVPPDLVALTWSGRAFTYLSSEGTRPDGEVMVGQSSPPADLDPSDLAPIQAAIEELAPGARVVRAEAHDWLADPFSKGTWMSYRPGHMARFHSALQRPEGRVVMAGADLATRWVGWIDGALESGYRAAREAASLLESGTVRL